MFVRITCYLTLYDCIKTGLPVFYNRTNMPSTVCIAAGHLYIFNTLSVLTIL